MGGNALNNMGIETRRVSTEELHQIYADVSKKLYEELGLETYMGEFYREKPDHGDCDILFKVDNAFYNKHINMTEWIKENFNTKGVFHNGSVNSFEYDNFQVDLIPIAESNWEIAKVWFSNDPLYNLLGKISYKFGIKFGPDGFRFVYYNDDKSKTHEILLTKDPKRIHDFLDLDYSIVEKGFDTVKDIYDFLLTSKYFSVDIYQYENLRHIDKKRNLRRKSYNEFLTYINENSDNLPHYNFNEDKKSYIPMIVEAFPECNIYEKIEKFEKKERIRKEIASKFNGNIIMEMFPELTGKDLGKFINTFKMLHGEHFNEYVLKTDPEKIKEAIKYYYVKWVKNKKVII